MALKLSDLDRELAGGVHGGAAAFAMRLLMRLAEAVDARSFIAIEQAHVDGCLYLGRASLDFVRAHDRPRRQGSRADEPQRRLARSHPSRALSRFGRSAREWKAAHAGACRARLRADLHLRPLSDCASTAFRRADRLGRVERDRLRQFGHRRQNQPLWRLHRSLLRNDRPCARVWPASHREPVRAGDCRDRLNSARLGYGARLRRSRSPRRAALRRAHSGNRRPARRRRRRQSEGARRRRGLVRRGGALSRCRPHPEAPDLATACGGLKPELVLRLSADSLRASANSLSDVADGAPLAAVTLGTPHFSLREFARLGPLLDGPRPVVDIWINCSRATLEELRARGWEERLAAAGVTLVVDTCVYVTTLMRVGAGAVMTNSGKCAYYAPGNLGVEVAYGSLADCIASARAGKVVRL